MYLLDNICNSLYSNSEYGATARSIKIEDIQDKMDLSVWDYHNYTYNDLKYGDSTTIETRATTIANYPYLWTREKSEKNAIDGIPNQGTLEQSQQDELTLETGYKTATTSMEMTLTYWESRSLTSNNFRVMPVRNTESTGQTYSDLLKTASSGISYFISSRYCSPRKDQPAVFGIYYINDIAIKGYESIGWNSIEKSNNSAFVRPIVTLPKSALDLSAIYEDTGVWNLK